MTRFCPLFLAVFLFPFILFSQTIKLVDSHKEILQGKVLYDSGKYQEAVDHYQVVSPNDSNYVWMLAELALTYIALKQPEEAIETCKAGLLNPSAHRAHLLKSMAIAYDLHGQYEKSVSIFEKAIQDYPHQYSLYYNLGVTHFNAKQYEKALKCFTDALRINSYHPGSHYYLGKISLLQGKRVRAMMALGIYLSINNEDNERLLYLEKSSNNEIPEEGSVVFTGKSSFDKLDQIIKARIVNDKNFKSRVPVDAMLVKQFQLLNDQLSLTTPAENDFWMEFYYPLYKQVKDKDLIEPFLYHLLSSTGNATVAKWQKKNSKQLNVFFDAANAWLKGFRSKRSIPGYDGSVTSWYNDNNDLEAIGNEDAAGVRLGEWQFFDGNGVCTARGRYDAGEKSGTWTYYHLNGVISKIENYSTGEIKAFTDNGKPLHKYFLINDNVTGEVEFYFPCDVLSEKLSYKDGQRNGPGTSYFMSGQKEVEYTFLDNELHGKYVVYYDGGQVASISIYDSGKLHGPYKSFYENGVKKAEGQHKDGMTEGLWQYYYSNGKLQKKGEFAADKFSGEWIFYDTKGNVTEKQQYDDKGELHGNDSLFTNGKLNFLMTFSQGKVVNVQYYDGDGNILGESGDASGNFDVTGYYPTGQVRYKGTYKDGVMDGHWTYYYRDGGVESKSTYVQGKVDGLYEEYFKSGGKKYEVVYKEGNEHGYFKEFFPHGQLKQEGWNQNGNGEQQWIGYHANGLKEYEYYYLNGALHGTVINYNADGKPYYEGRYDKGKINSVKYLNESGQVIFGDNLSGVKQVLENKYANGNLHTKLTFTCGNHSDNMLRWLPNGKPLLVNPIRNGNKHGRYQFFYPNGTLEVEGNYVTDKYEGVWKWYYFDGKKYSEGFYRDNQRDSVWTYYFENGKVSDLIEYSEGKKSGLSKVFSPEGVLLLEKLFEEGDFVAYRKIRTDGTPDEWVSVGKEVEIVLSYANGKKALEERYVNNVLEGTQRLYYASGQLYSEFNCKKGDYMGDYAFYYSNGKPREKGAYLYDEHDGIIEHYNEDGTLRLTEQYNVGVRNGPSTVYEKGKQKEQIVFWAGLIVK